MLPNRDRKDDSLSRRGLGMTFMVNMFDSQKRSCQFKWESACHSNLTCHSVTLITLICTSLRSTLSPWIIRVLLLRLFTALILYLVYQTIKYALFSFKEPLINCSARKM